MGRRWHGLWLAILLLVGFVGIGSAMAETPPFGGGAPRMSLGGPADQWTSDGASQSKPVLPGQSKDQCRKWRAMSARLGETYAGHTVRQSVLKRVCGLLDSERSADIWDWPWNGLAQGRLVPPRAYRMIGAWEIRCGVAAHRRRCALVHSASLPADGEPKPNVPSIVTHFVVDMVAGREVLLWRMFVPGATKTLRNPDSTRQEAHLSEESATSVRVAGVGATPPPLSAVRYSLAQSEQREIFSACVSQGCLMEANVKRGGRVASELWEGHPLVLDVETGTGRSMRVTLPAKDFRAGLKELIRLRREEDRRQPSR